MFNNLYHNKKVLVTGHTGFKGSWLTEWLLLLGAKVSGYSKDIPTQPSLFEALRLEDRIQHHIGDVRDKAHFLTALQETRPDFVFHLAAQPIVRQSYIDPSETVSTNVLGTNNVLDALRINNQPCTAVIITSDKCYHNVEWTWGYRENDRLGGNDPYSASKGAAELIIHTYFTSFFQTGSSPVRIASARAGNVIGGGDWADSRLVPDAFRAWATGEKVEIRSPKATRPWQHVLEPLSGYLRLGECLAKSKDLNGESFNFGPPSEQSHTVLELLEALEASWKLNDQIIVGENPGFHEAGLLKLNCDKALHKLKWQPALPFPETATFTATWYEQYYRQEQSANLREFTSKQITKYAEAARNRNIAWAIQ
ncbi:CDP-glucose 4,6-dehydratase [Phaeodactylibacter xiamenensis]|uniref:CDP-glucose 4,6-dehydratase n=1 Tax=Phaeodactylibacter xiamenensis TaxID=1524460 RepID=UPI003CCB8CC8